MLADQLHETEMVPSGRGDEPATIGDLLTEARRGRALLSGIWRWIGFIGTRSRVAGWAGASSAVWAAGYCAGAG